MKKMVALLLTLILCVGVLPAVAEGIAKEDIKMGVILLHDEDSTYDMNFINGVTEAFANLGLSEDQLIIARNQPESNQCAETALDLIDEGCNMIFFDSYGHQFYTDDVVAANPEVKFFHATGDRAHTLPYENVYNAFADIYEGRYLAGIAAGMKLNELKEAGKLKGETPLMGYVGAYTYAEVVSGYTSFYLGAKSVCPDVQMKVQFTGEWYDEKLEKDAAQALIALGCDLISQHADSMGAPTACENAGIPNVCYNISTKESCPNTYLVFSRINWAPYFEYIVNQTIAGEKIDVDWVGTLAGTSVIVTDLNEAVAAAGTQEAIDAAAAELMAGTLHVFDTAKEGFITVNGEALTEDWQPGAGTDGSFVEGTKIVYDGYFHESQYRSAPYFDAAIDGIEQLNQKF
ncbi:MAG: BMP family ABC transporter substrate-binding protein [Clostridia bacterium]|nr:BMP family ABC transporter substrate-binding protein [Clostridia bacterium]